MQEQQQPRTLEPRIVRAHFVELTIYDVSEAELEAIERGGPESIYLNFGIFFISTAVSFTVVLATTKIESIRLYNGFFVVTAVSFAAAVVLGSLWVRGFRSKKSIISCIRGRRPTSGDAMPLPPV